MSLASEIAGRVLGLPQPQTRAPLDRSTYAQRKISLACLSFKSSLCRSSWAPFSASSMTC